MRHPPTIMSRPHRSDWLQYISAVWLPLCRPNPTASPLNLSIITLQWCTYTPSVATKRTVCLPRALRTNTQRHSYPQIPNKLGDDFFSICQHTKNEKKNCNHTYQHLLGKSWCSVVFSCPIILLNLAECLLSYQKRSRNCRVKRMNSRYWMHVKLRVYSSFSLLEAIKRCQPQKCPIQRKWY